MAETTYSMPPIATVPVSVDHMVPLNVYKSTIYKLGISEIVLGCLFCVLCIVHIIVTAMSGEVGYIYVCPGIWCGVFAIVSGGLGVCARKEPSLCMYNANMAMSIISAVFMGILFLLSVLSALSFRLKLEVCLQVVMAVGSISAMVVSIVHSVYCCVGVCCRSRSSAGVMYTTATQAVSGQQHVQLPNSQHMSLQTQPFLGPGDQVMSIPNGDPCLTTANSDSLNDLTRHPQNEQQGSAGPAPPLYDATSYPVTN